VGNPAEETCCHPNYLNVTTMQRFVNTLLLNIVKYPVTFDFALPPVFVT
jgi:hypothetical protein